jgi:NAD(P)-dependent dehydrogenase (short-subunit alcohol dehydrogenase family)
MEIKGSGRHRHRRRIGPGGATAARLARRREGHAVRSQRRLGRGQGGGDRRAFKAVNVTDEAAVENAILEAEAVTARRASGQLRGHRPARQGDRPRRQGAAAGRFAKIININLIGTFNVLSKFAARITMPKRWGRKRGVIVNTASVAAFDGQIGQAAYAASKGGVVA